MTVKEFYEWAKSIGAENAPIRIANNCSDDWYSCDYLLMEKDLDITENEVVINIYT